MPCRYCERADDRCRNTRDMEEIGDQICFDALLRLGGGERSWLRTEAERRKEVWLKHRDMIKQ